MDNTMTVWELIKKLVEFPPETEVGFGGDFLAVYLENDVVIVEPE